MKWRKRSHLDSRYSAAMLSYAGSRVTVRCAGGGSSWPTVVVMGCMAGADGEPATRAGGRRVPGSQAPIGLADCPEAIDHGARRRIPGIVPSVLPAHDYLAASYPSTATGPQPLRSTSTLSILECNRLFRNDLPPSVANTCAGGPHSGTPTAAKAPTARRDLSCLPGAPRGGGRGRGRRFPGG